MENKLHFEQQNILVIGDLMVDKYLVGNVSRISPEAPVPVVLINKTEKRLGGAGNVINNLISLNANVRLFGFVGKDTNGRWLKEQMKNKGVDVEYLYLLDGYITGVKTRIASQNQQLLRYDEEKVELTPPAIIEKLHSNLEGIFTKISGVIISDYGKGVITEELAQIVIEEANKRDIPVFVDPKGADYSKYRNATCCTPNMKEIQEATNLEIKTEEELFDAAMLLCNNFHLNYVLVTRSEKGLSLIQRMTNEKFDFPVFEKEVIDVTGAGDTVVSVFSLCFTAGFRLSECCEISNVAASVVCSKFGTATVKVDEITTNIKKDNTNKLVSEESAEQWIEELRSQGKKIVFTNGCFDLVHAGHIATFKKAKGFGDALIVGLNSDTSIKRLKGETRPIVDQKNRAELLSSIEFIDKIIVFESDTPEELIRKIKPDILVKGKDWKNTKIAGADFVESNGGRVIFVELEEGLSTTSIIDKIKNM